MSTHLYLQASPYRAFTGLNPTLMLSPTMLRSPLTKACFSPLGKLPGISRPGAPSVLGTPELGADPKLENAVQLLAGSGEVGSSPKSTAARHL